MKLESLGNILSAGFGNKVLVGIMVGFLEGVTPERACEYIRDDLELGYWLSEERWQKYRKLAKGAKIQNVSTEDIIVELRKRRPDLLGVILNDLKGRQWFDSQIANMKEKLDLE